MIKMNRWGWSLLAAVFCTGAALATELGDPAPALQIGNWVKGDAVDLAAGKGKNIYVIEFWATWCPPCRESIPHLSELQKNLKDQNVVFLGISAEDNDTVKTFVDQMGAKMDYHVAIDKDQKTSASYMEAFGVMGIPHAFVVNKDGALVWHGHPMDRLEDVLKDLAAGKFDLEAEKRATKAEAALGDYFKLIHEKGDAKKIQALGEQIVTDGAKNTQLLFRFAWQILADPQAETRDVPLALRAAKTAYETTAGKDLSATVVYGRALFESGQKDEAIRIHQTAIAMAPNEDAKAQLTEMLEHYQGKPHAEGGHEHGQEAEKKEGKE